MVVDCKKTDIVNKCCDLDAMVQCQIAEMVNKASDLEAMLQRKMTATMKAFEELCKVTESNARQRGCY